MLTNFPLGSQILTGLFLNITLSGPQGAAVTYEKTLFDRIGYAARQGGGSIVLPPINPTGQPILTNNDLWTINALPGLQSPAVIGGELSALNNLQAQFSPLLPTINAIPSTGQETPEQQAAVSEAGSLNREIALLNNEAPTIAFARASDRATAQLETGYRPLSYDITPRLLVASTQQNGGSLSAAIDLMKDDARDIEFPGQAVGVVVLLRADARLFRQALEGQVLSAATGQQAVTFDAVTQALAAQGGQLVLITQDNLNVPRWAVALGGRQGADHPGGRVGDGRAHAVADGDDRRPVDRGMAPSQLRDGSGHQRRAGRGSPGGHRVRLRAGQPDQRRLDRVHRHDAGVRDLAAQVPGPLPGRDHLGQGPRGRRPRREARAGHRPGQGLHLAARRGDPGARRPARWEALGAEVAKSILGLAVGPVLFDKPLDPLEVGEEVIKLILGKTLPGFSNLSLAFDAGMVAGSAYGIYYIATTLPGDPPLFPALTTELASASPLNFASGTETVAAWPCTAHLSSTVNTGSIEVTNQLTASWSSSSVAGFQVSSLSAAEPHGHRCEWEAGRDRRGRAGRGDPDRRGRLGQRPVQRQWHGQPLVLRPGRDPARRLRRLDELLGDRHRQRVDHAHDRRPHAQRPDPPRRNVHDHDSSATLAGSGPSTSPNFAGSVSITATERHDQPRAGDRQPLRRRQAARSDRTTTTLDGYTGTITVSANGDGTDAVTLNGNAGNVLQVSASPSTLTTDQNTPVTFPANVQTSLADTYTLTANAPPGWTVTIDSSGNVTATPAPGLQSGTYPIQIIAQSQTDPNLVAQTTVDVTITPTQPGITFAVAPDPQFTVPFNGAQLPTAFRATIQNLGPAADTYNLTFSNVPSGFTLLDSGTSVTVPAGETGILGIYLEPNTGQPIPPPGTAALVHRHRDQHDDSVDHPDADRDVHRPGHRRGLADEHPGRAQQHVRGRRRRPRSPIENVGNVSENVTLTGRDAQRLDGQRPDAGHARRRRNPDRDGHLDSSFLGHAESVALDHDHRDLRTVRDPLTTAPDRPARAIRLRRSPCRRRRTRRAQRTTLSSHRCSPTSQLPWPCCSPPPRPPSSPRRSRLGNLNPLLPADPALASFESQHTLISAQSGDLTDRSHLGQPVQQHHRRARGEATEQFTASLTPNEVDLEPTQGRRFTSPHEHRQLCRDLETVGGDCPPASTVSLASNVSLTPGASRHGDGRPHADIAIVHRCSLCNVTAAASVASQTASAVVAVRPAMADVLSVTVTPSTVTAGDAGVGVRQVFNTANVDEDVRPRSRSSTPRAPPSPLPRTCPVNLVPPGTGDLTLNLGQVATTGLADGLYDPSLLVDQRRHAASGPVFGYRLRGRPAGLGYGPASPTFVPPGTSTVTTTITVTNKNWDSAAPPSSASTSVTCKRSISMESQASSASASSTGRCSPSRIPASTPITNGILTVNPPGGPEDSFNVGTVAAGTFVLVSPASRTMGAPTIPSSRSPGLSWTRATRDRMAITSSSSLPACRAH